MQEMGADAPAIRLRRLMREGVKGRVRARKGFVLLFLLLSILAVVPAVGLGIDVTILYLVKAKLTTACDGASLAAARNLNLGLTMAQQAASAQQRAQSYYQADYPARYLGSIRNPATITVPIVPPGSALTVTTTGSADVQTFFMRLLNTSLVHVTATGTASRKSLNMMMVLDRSSSMSATDAGSGVSRVNAMKSAASDFVDKFSAMDTIGMSYFGSDTVLAFPPSANYQTASPNIKYYINQITAGDNTATTLALWQAYQTLVNLHQPSALNVIVLFTDGIPNGFCGTFTKKTIADTRYGSSNTGTLTPYGVSGCTVSSFTGVISQWSGFANTGTTVGVYSPYGTASANHAASWISASGCAFPSNSNQMRQDVAYMPDVDALGNRTRGYGSDYITFTTTDMGLPSGDFQPGYPAQIRVDSPWVIGLATKNTLDHAAIRIRAQVLDATISIPIYVIGFGPSGVTTGDIPDDVLMRRIANDPDPSNTIYDPNAPAGKYIKSTNASQMHQAFDSIGSELLRLSH